MYIPQVLLCGNLEKFLAEMQGRAVEVVGRIKFIGAAERGEFIMPASATAAENFRLEEGSFHIFIDDKEISSDTLKKFLAETVDYIVLQRRDEFLMRFRELYALKLIDRVVTVPTLMTYAKENFFALNNFIQIYNLIHELNLRTLDVDGYFAANDCHMFPRNSKIVGIVRNVKFPAIENFYAEIHATIEACRYATFDAILLTAERNDKEFLDALIDLDNFSEKILTFARSGSELERWLTTYKKIFRKVSEFPAVNGKWILLEKIAEKNFMFFVVTHKKVAFTALPENYTVIHAGHINAAENFGDIADDTGDNISALNLYLNEITALYWLWKNTTCAYVGFVHYRRFFTTKPAQIFNAENILTADEALKILADFDIIVDECRFGYVPLRDWKAMLSSRPLAERVINTIRKYIADRQPEYLEAYDRVNNGFGTFCYEIFVTRRKVLDGYCKWLFSFLIDATKELLDTTEIADSDDPRTWRAISFVAEHLMGVWLIKNRLKIKTLPIMFRRDV